MDWIGDCIGSGAPSPSRLWSAISTVAATLQCRVFARALAGRKAYANLFVILVPPSDMARQSVHRAAASIKSLGEGYFVTMDPLTRGSLRDALKEARVRPTDRALAEYSSPFVCETDLGVSLRRDSKATLHYLNDLWDCPPKFSWALREGDRGVIPNPQVNLLAVSTRDRFDSLTRTNSAFRRRCVVVNCKDERPSALFGDQGATSSELLDGLRQISSLRGKFHMDSDFRSVFEDWQQELEHIAGHIHLSLKLCMIAAASEMRLVCGKEHVDLARNWLREAGIS